MMTQFPAMPDNELSESEILLGRIEIQTRRIKELEDAIRTHFQSFPDEPLQGELDLWQSVGIISK